MSANSENDVFERHVELYDALVDWPKRLAREASFYRHWFAEACAKRVLDVACGTGHHAHMFHEWGLDVEGADVSPAMIGYCRRLYGESPGLLWVERSFTRAADPAGRFDAVLCVGNSLALADSLSAVHAVLAAMIASLRAGGVCVIHVLNIDALPDGPTQWQKCVRVRISAGACGADPPGAGGEEDHVLLKSIRRVGGKAFIDFVDIELMKDGGARHRAMSESLLGLRSDDLADVVRAAGARDVQCFGSYRQEPFSPRASTDLICVCRKP